MINRFVIIASVSLMVVHAAVAQTVSRAFVAADGAVHITDANGTEKAIPPEQQQVACEAVSVAEDQRTVGWTVLVNNCCTSYPIPTAVVVYRNGRKTVIFPGQMVYQWHFVARGKRIAILSGPVHGRAATASLFEAQSGRMLKTWYGRGTVPDWAKGWVERF